MLEAATGVADSMVAVLLDGGDAEAIGWLDATALRAGATTGGFSGGKTTGATRATGSAGDGETAAFPTTDCVTGCDDVSAEPIVLP